MTAETAWERGPEMPASAEPVDEAYGEPVVPTESADDTYGPFEGSPDTGHPSIDAAVRALAQAAGTDPGDQVPAFQAAHRTLRETLASIDET